MTNSLSNGSDTLKGAYGTLVMHTDGSYSYVANPNISLPSDGIVQDSFILAIGDGHGNTGSAVLTRSGAAQGLARPGRRRPLHRDLGAR